MKQSDAKVDGPPSRAAVLLALTLALGACSAPPNAGTISSSKSPVAEARTKLVSAKNEFNQRNLQQAISILDKVIASHALAGSDLAQAYYLRGRAYSRLRRATKAKSDYSMAISIDPRFADAYGSRCRVNVALGYTYDASNDCNIALSLNPQSSTAYANRATLNSKLGRYDAAITDHNKAISLAPQNWILVFNRGMTYRDMNNEDFARRDVEAAFKHSAPWARTTEPYATSFRQYGLIQ